MNFEAMQTRKFKKRRKAKAVVQKQHDGLLTTWICILMLYHGSIILFWGVQTLLLYRFFGGSGTSTSEFAAAHPETYQAIIELAYYFIPYLGVRAIAFGCLALILRWSRMAFWAYCVCTAVIFVLNILGGAGFYDAMYEPIGLGILIALLHMTDPPAWPQLE